MKAKILLIVILAFTCAIGTEAQTTHTSELEGISKTLTDYIEGSTNGQPTRLAGAFHEDLNLYSVKDGQLKTWSGKAYIEDTKEGKPTGEIGKIISIDYENNIAVAKVQISYPGNPQPYIDYFMLLKLEEGWKIIHKMYTKRVNK